MKKSEILKKARKLLWAGESLTGKCTFICNAISAAAWSAPEHIATLKREVAERIAGFSSVEDFMVYRHGFANRNELYTNFSEQEIQKIRFEILDSMISDFENQGD